MCRINNVVFVLFLCTSCLWAKELTEIEALSSHPNHCTYEYAFDMYGAHCAGLRLNKLPNLRGGIEILDFTDNKLQELNGNTFSGYSNIKYLYLADNQIYLIEEEALISLTSLQTLDLSNNVILELPNSLFQLPSLRKLYLKGNPILHKSIKELSIHKPIRAPLELLDISDCKLRELPNWGSLPQLVFYNISHNPLTSLDAAHFAAMCNLAKVDLTESLDKMQLCGMRAAISWFQARKVNFQLDDYTRLNTRASTAEGYRYFVTIVQNIGVTKGVDQIFLCTEFESCHVPDELEVYNATYYQCKSVYLEVQHIKTTRRTWMTVGGGLAGFLVGFILLLYIMHRHNVAQTRTTAEKMQQEKAARVGDKSASAVLLNDAS